jgi:hypothetical protein
MPARAVDVALDRVIDRPPDPRPEPAPWTARPAASQLPARGYALKAV